MIKTTSSTARASEVRVGTPNAGREPGEEHQPVTQVATTHAAGSLHKPERERNNMQRSLEENRRQMPADTLFSPHTRRRFDYILFGAHYRQERPHQKSTHHTYEHTQKTSLSQALQASKQYIRSGARRSVHISERK